MVEHKLEYSIWSAKVTWCPICHKHFYTSTDNKHVVEQFQELQEQRPLTEIATEVLQCANSWEPQVCLLGNVRADEVARLATSFLETKEGA